jgi:CoA:oxalate CoA-transferase
MGPLSDLLVVDFTHHIAGPYCTMLMADLGARVLKIEPPGRGEPGRAIDPLLKAEDGTLVSGSFARMNRNKRSVAIDLKAPQGRQAALRLAAKADIVVENFRPGTLADLGLAYEDVRRVNERVIYASISGFGALDLLPGPFVDRPAFAIVAEAMGGVTDLQGVKGGPPMWGGYGLGDLAPAVFTFGAIMVALHKRTVTGEGSRVDIAMYDGMAALNERTVSTRSLTGRVMTRGLPSMNTPFGIFRGRDGYVAIAVLGEPLWQRLCRAIGRPELTDDPVLGSRAKRAEVLDSVVQPLLEDWLAQRPDSESIAILLSHGVPAGPVQNAADVSSCPHLEARKMFVELPMPPLQGTYRFVGNPIKMSGFVETPAGAPPALGDYTVAALREVGRYSAQEVEALLAEAAVAQHKSGRAES